MAKRARIRELKATSTETQVKEAKQKPPAYFYVFNDTEATQSRNNPSINPVNTDKELEAIELNRQRSSMKEGKKHPEDNASSQQG